MAGKRLFGGHQDQRERLDQVERRDSSRPFDDFSDDGDEPFEQLTPLGAASSAASSATSSSTGADTFSRSSERSRGHARKPSRGSTRHASDQPSIKAINEAPDRFSSPENLPSDTRDKPRNAAAFKRSLRGRALAYLSRREHSRDELTRKLTPHLEETEGPDTISVLLDALTREGWLSDTRFAESVVNRRASRFGPSRIVSELKRHKVNSELIQQLGSDLRETEWERIRAVWARKFGTLATTPQERAKQARFLAARGFSRDLIMRVLKLGDEEMPEGE